MKVYGRNTFTSDVTPPRGYVTSKEAIEILGITYRHLWRLQKQGAFPGAIKPERYWFFPREEVQNNAKK